MISISSLIYKSIEYLEFLIDSLNEYTPKLHTGEAELYFVSYNATPEILDYMKRHKIPNYIVKGKYVGYPQSTYGFYKAFNYCVEKAKGDIVVLLNSDMAFSPDWLENLLKYLNKDRLITSRLVESGNLRSTFPHTLVKDFGRSPSTFKEKEFLEYAEKVKQEGISQGGTFMPVAIYKDVFVKTGGYPLGNVGNMGGDYYYFEYILKPSGVIHYTSFDSIVYHIQMGEVHARV